MGGNAARAPGRAHMIEPSVGQPAMQLGPAGPSWQVSVGAQIFSPMHAQSAHSGLPGTQCLRTCAPTCVTQISFWAQLVQSTTYWHWSGATQGA